MLREKFCPTLGLTAQLEIRVSWEIGNYKQMSRITSLIGDKTIGSEYNRYGLFLILQTDWFMIWRQSNLIGSLFCCDLDFLCLDNFQDWMFTSLFILASAHVHEYGVFTYSEPEMCRQTHGREKFSREVGMSGRLTTHILYHNFHAGQTLPSYTYAWL